ncbi:MAG: hypothetical protein GDA56_09295 [Hormoscilla sp. GM7CHS1pb]|nr:hypothetical protein [Hormoscilla sp. GM7CHS1pb]
MQCLTIAYSAKLKLPQHRHSKNLSHSLPHRLKPIAIATRTDENRLTDVSINSRPHRDANRDPRPISYPLSSTTPKIHKLQLI